MNVKDIPAVNKIDHTSELQWRIRQRNLLRREQKLEEKKAQEMEDKVNYYETELTDIIDTNENFSQQMKSIAKQYVNP